MEASIFEWLEENGEDYEYEPASDDDRRRLAKQDEVNEEQQHAVVTVDEPVRHRRYRRKIEPDYVQKHRRRLQDSTEVECKSEEEIREYLKTKTLVIFATTSFVDEETEAEINENKVISYMVPIAEKRLDFRYHKEIIV